MSVQPITSSPKALGHPRPFAVAQLGARMHYAVPRILEAAGLLQRLYTDAICPAVFTHVPDRLKPGILRRLERRRPTGVSPRRVTSFPWLGLRYAWQQHWKLPPHRQVEAYLWSGREFGRRVVRSGLKGADAVYTFNSAALEILQHARQTGRFRVLEQTIAPKRVERVLLDEECARWPGWVNGLETPRELDQEYGEREVAEWNIADLILCASDFVAEGIESAGGPRKRCVVVPYGVDPYFNASAKRRSESGPLHVLFAGRIGLRKGAPYLAECANLLASRSFQFRAVGPVDLHPKILGALASRIEMTGAISRPEMENMFSWAHVLVLPTLCEGSATVCYEALAAGLPVITTPNAGSVVRNGVDGFIVPIRDADEIATKLETLFADTGLLDAMSHNARLRASEFTLEKYSERLLAAVQEHLPSHR